MNCDQVFDILTRGPFPTGTDCDEPVEAHLGQCAECRRLAEALRPALELFQEAVDPEESRDLPGYWSALASERAAVVYASEVESQPAATRSAVRSVLARVRGRWSPLAAWQMAAMLALGVTLGMLAANSGRLDGWRLPGFRQDAFMGPTLRRAGEVGDQAARRLGLALPVACLADDRRTGMEERGAAGASDEADLASLQCCAQCHRPVAAAPVPTAATVRVAASCQLCHNDRKRHDVLGVEP
jgi:hypothetical protein